MGQLETFAQPSFPYPPAVIPVPTRRHSRESGNPGEGPQAGGSCFTFTTSPFKESYAKVSTPGTHRATPAGAPLLYLSTSWG